jgi:hypothetical protein
MQERPLVTAVGALALVGVAGALTLRPPRDDDDDDAYPSRVGITLNVDPARAHAFWCDPEQIQSAGLDPRAFAAPHEKGENRLAWRWGTVRVDPAPGARGVEVRIASRKSGLPGALTRERLREGLRKMKMLLETGEIATARPRP